MSQKIKRRKMKIILKQLLNLWNTWMRPNNDLTYEEFMKLESKKVKTTTHTRGYNESIIR